MGSDELNTLEEELRRLRSIVSDSTEFIKRWHPDGTHTYVNDAYCRFLGREREQILGTSFLPQLDSKTRSLLKKRIAKLTPTDAVAVDEYPIERANSTIWLEWTDRAIFDEHGSIVEVHSVGRNVTDRHRAMEGLRDSEERYRNLVEEAIDAILVCSQGGRILHLNPAGVGLLGFESKQEAIGTDIRDLYAEPSRYDESISELIDTGSLGDVEGALVARDGRDITVLQSASVIRDSAGRISAVRMILHDITRRRQLEQQLYHAQRLEAVGKLAAGIAHDFNNLLTVIGGNAELLASDFSPGSPHRVAIEAVREASEKAVSLTQQLLAYGRRQILQPETVDLNTIIEQTTAMLRRVVGEDVEILTSLGPNLGSVEVDPQQMKQVLVNLALNARDSMPQGGRLEIGTSAASAVRHRGQELESGRFVQVTVSDTGEGIPKEHLDRIFEPFFTTKQMQRGTGLGLATVYGIVRQSQGRIFARNRRVEGGAAFDIFLPCVGEPVSPSGSTGVGDDPWTPDETVLLVEDDTSVLSTMRKTLERRGYRVLEASSGPEALAIYRDHHQEISLVLADIVMPRMNGYEMVDAMVESSPPRVLFITGYSDETLSRQAASLPNAYPLLRKPFSPAMLVTRVRAVLDQVRAY